EAYRADFENFRSKAAGHAVMDEDLDVTGQQLTAQLGREVIADPPRGEAHQRRAMQRANHDLRVAVTERESGAQPIDFEARRVLEEAQHVRRLVRELGAHFEYLPDRPEAEEPDAVLALSHQLAALLRSEGALSRVADVRGDVGERLGSHELRDHALAVVEHVERRDAVLAKASDADLPRPGVHRVLHQLGERLARIGLRASKPADELERIGRLEPPDDRVGVLAAGHYRGTLARDRGQCRGSLAVGLRLYR